MHSKNSEKSIEYLDEARKLREQLKLSHALVSLNKSLCFATSNNQFSVIYAERASIFYEVEKFQNALENIKFARSYGYVGELLHIEDDSIKQLKNDENHETSPWNYFKLSQPTNKKIPFISDCLKLHESWKYGRYIKTDRALRTGEVVIIEEPLFKMPNKNARYKRCSNCLKSNNLSLIPCLQGCVSTMYCSEECKKIGWTRYHKYECGLLEESLESNEYDLMVQRIIFESLALCDGSLEKLKTLLCDTKINKSIYDFDLNVGNDNENDKFRLKSIYALKRGINSEEDKAMAEWFLESDLTIKSLCITSDKRDFMKQFILKIMGILDRNSYIFYSLESMSSEKDEEIGTGLFPFASLLNHSCSPNLYRFFVENKQVYVTKRPIDAGQQLFVGYLSNFTQCDRETRQMNLLQDFQFKCSCEACANNYPLLKDLKRYDKHFKNEPPTLSRYSILDAQKMYNENCEYIEKNIRKFPFPCYEICYTMQSSFRLLHFLANKPFLID